MNKGNSIRVLAAAVLTLCLAGTAWSHHSAAQFDFGNGVVVTGVVKYIRFANPHAKLVLEVTDDARGTREIEFEGHSRNNMIRQGLMPDMMEVGDTITIQIAPMRDGTDGGYVTGLRMPDGRMVGNVTAAD
jgi:hypothetical protein